MIAATTRLAFALLAVLNLVSGRVSAETIKSADGRVIEANVREIKDDGLLIEKDGTIYSVTWDKLDPEFVLGVKLLGVIDLKKDRFEGMTTGHIKDVPFDQTGSDEIKLNGEVYVSPLTGNDFALNLRFTRIAQDWRWLKYNTLAMLIDGQKFDAPKTRLTTDVFDKGYVYESVSMEVSTTALRQMANAKSVEVRIGILELVFQERHMKALRSALMLREWAEKKKAKGAQ